MAIFGFFTQTHTTWFLFHQLTYLTSLHAKLGLQQQIFTDYDITPC